MCVEGHAQVQDYRTGVVFTGLHAVIDHCQVVHVLCLFGSRSVRRRGRGLVLRAERLRCHSVSVLLRADWLVWLLGLLHAAGRLGGAGTGGHQTAKTERSVEGKLKAGGALKRVKHLESIITTAGKTCI